VDMIRNHPETPDWRPVRPRAVRSLSHYRLSPSGPFHRAGTDGRDIGADVDALAAALQAAQGRDPGPIANPGRGEGSPGKARP